MEQNPYKLRYRALVLLLLSALLPATAATRKVSVDEARGHLITPQPVIRAQRSPYQNRFESVVLRLVVDPAGNVRSAELEGSSSFASRAVEIAKTLRYRPFLQDGVAVEAEVEQYIRILPMEVLPATHNPFPGVADVKDVEFSLSRSRCFGACPSYELRITGDGVVRYEGKSSVAVVGQRTDRISAESVQQLLQAFRAADFFSLSDSYRMMVTDCPTYEIGVRVGGRSKRIVDYVGEEVGMPGVVTELEDLIDNLTDSQKWVNTASLNYRQ